MSINHLLIVLGKRLCDDQLTAEGHSRIVALVNTLVANPMENVALAFCGGITKGQSVSEAECMHQYFRELERQRAQPFELEAVLLEQQSTNTIENIENLAAELIESQLFERGQALKVTLVSNDYHLQRIFEIQDLMDEQGLLKVLIERCRALGVELDIDRNVNTHVMAPYPHHSQQGQLFLLMDILTTYRVYLEGVSQQAFTRDLQEVRQAPQAIALDALNNARQLLKSGGQSFNQHQDFGLAEALLPVLETCINQTPASAPIEKVREYLALLDTNLTLLNRYLDPEQENRSRWWR